MVCSKNVSELLKNEMAEELQIKIVESHTRYMVLPIIFGHKKKYLFREIEEKVSRKLGNWKSKILLGVGREVLIKALLQAIPLYAMSCFKIPVTLCKKLAAYLIDFWWKKGPSGRGIHWIKVDTLFMEKHLGGLGFRKLCLLNLAMLAKQG
ncbi:hypothetical protein QQ045_029463 [Rhodiola kirilowii]